MFNAVRRWTPHREPRTVQQQSTRAPRTYCSTAHTGTYTDLWRERRVRQIWFAWCSCPTSRSTNTCRIDNRKQSMDVNSTKHNHGNIRTQQTHTPLLGTPPGTWHINFASGSSGCHGAQLTRGSWEEVMPGNTWKHVWQNTPLRPTSYTVPQVHGNYTACSGQTAQFTKWQGCHVITIPCPTSSQALPWHRHSIHRMMTGETPGEHGHTNGKIRKRFNKP